MNLQTMNMNNTMTKLDKTYFIFFIYYSKQEPSTAKLK